MLCQMTAFHAEDKDNKIKKKRKKERERKIKEKGSCNAAQAFIMSKVFGSIVK